MTFKTQIMRQERWFRGKEQLFLLQRTLAQFLPPTQWLATACDISVRGICCPFLTSVASVLHVVHLFKSGKNIYAHGTNLKLMLKRDSNNNGIDKADIVRNSI